MFFCPEMLQVMFSLPIVKVLEINDIDKISFILSNKLRSLAFVQVVTQLKSLGIKL